MVWSLVYSSLVSIANGIKDGTIQNPHMLPPKLRQRVLDTVLQRRLINQPNCMAILSSAQFLNGMESLGTEPGGYKLEFLERLETSMATVSPNGETVGAGIKKLNLSVYGCEVTRALNDMKASSYPMVARLIGQCPNTTSLALCGIKSAYPLTGENFPSAKSLSPWFPSVLNDVCNSVMENLIDLSLRDLEKVLCSGWPIIKFKQLTTLKLENCSLEFDIWPKFLINLPTLQNLHMIGVKGFAKYGNSYFYSDHMDPYGLDWILPIAMPHLQSLEIVSIEDYQSIYECNKTFVDNLMECQEIRRVHLTLDQNSTDEVSLVRLSSMNIDLKVKVRFSDWNMNRREQRRCKIRPTLDSSSQFKIVRIFNEKIDSFELYVWCNWMPELTTALENVIDSCSNLTTFSLMIPDKSYPSDATEIEPAEMERITAAMFQFFGTQERAMQLKDLRLYGKFDEAVILAAFDSCLDLDRLEISHCPVLRDQHLIDWVSNGGGKLKHLDVFSCRNITSEGIIPILAKSSESLLSIRVYPDQGDGEGRNWETMLNLCPFAKTK